MDKKILVNKFALVSTIRVEDIQLLEKYEPDALKIKDEEGNDLFVVKYESGKSSISKYGIVFGADKDGRAAVSGDIPGEGDADAKEWLADKIGKATKFIEALEASIPVAAGKVKAERTAFINSIQTL